MAVGCNIGDDNAMFEPIHGSAPKHAGKGRANPMATILSVKESLSWYAARIDHEGLARVAELVEQAVSDVVDAGDCLTYDLVGEEAASTTSAVGDAVVSRLGALLASD
jgi:3-isopropylmalate dehydrogenase